MIIAKHCNEEAAKMFGVTKEVIWVPVKGDPRHSLDKGGFRMLHTLEGKDKDLVIPYHGEVDSD